MNPSPVIPYNQPYWPQADGRPALNSLHQDGTAGMTIDSVTPPALKGGKGGSKTQ